MIESKSFTLKNDKGKIGQLITPCGVSEVFDPVKSKGATPKVSQYHGLWDTGASGTVISQKVVDDLGLKPTGKTIVAHADGKSEVPTYIINLYLLNQVGFPFIKVTLGKLTGFDLLIGMDIITMGDFSITNVGGKTTFSFRYPSIKEVDFVKEHQEIQSKPSVSTKSRLKTSKAEMPCHCGSGKKFKQCHGKIGSKKK